MQSAFLSLLLCAGLSHAWLPNFEVRGVNLGSQFIVEPWMASDEWSSMGCGNAGSEFDCVSALGQSAANSAFQHHWDTWTTQQDIEQMKSYGLNTIRIPIGYWIREDLVYTDSEHFPQGGLKYLERICGWASDAGMYIIIDLHGAPGAQVSGNPDIGQVRDERKKRICRVSLLNLVLNRPLPPLAFTWITSTNVRTSFLNGWSISSTQITITATSACSKSLTSR